MAHKANINRCFTAISRGGPLCFTKQAQFNKNKKPAGALWGASAGIIVGITIANAT
jgi:hypothetical protein